MDIGAFVVQVKIHHKIVVKVGVELFGGSEPGQNPLVVLLVGQAAGRRFQGLVAAFTVALGPFTSNLQIVTGEDGKQNLYSISFKRN